MLVGAYRVSRSLWLLLVLVAGVGLAIAATQSRFDYQGTWSAERNAVVGSGPTFMSRAVVVIDVASGRLLLGHNAYTKLLPGPLAHMLTALTVVHHEEPDQMVLISRQAAGHPGVRLGLMRGIAVPVRTLLQALWYLGAADAGMALVEHVAGSDTAFRRQMADQARRHGALESVIVSPLGNDVADQWSTAYDLALLARAALDHPLLAPLMAERRVLAEWDDTQRELLHVNSFLWQYPGATGVKSGFSEGAGFVVAASAQRGSRHLVVVVLGAETPQDRYHDATAALDYAFRHFGMLLEAPHTDALPYDVQPGDTLLGIAAQTGVNVASIQAWNQLADPNRLSVGTRLWLPMNPEEAPVRPTG